MADPTRIRVVVSVWVVDPSGGGPHKHRHVCEGIIFNDDDTVTLWRGGEGRTTF